MKLKTILVGQSVRYIVLREPTGGIFAPDFLNLMSTQFKFVTTPKSIADMDRAKGITFEHGSFLLPKETGRDTEGKSIVIDKFQVFNNGLLVQTRSYSEDADLFIDSFIDWSIAVLGVIKDESQPITTSLLSSLEIEMKNPFVRLSKEYEAITKNIAATLKGYGVSSPNFEQIALEFHFDKTSAPSGAPNGFKIERRDGFAFDGNTFFSSAPMKTQDHLKLLAQIEDQR